MDQVPHESDDEENNNDDNEPHENENVDDHHAFFANAHEGMLIPEHFVIVVRGRQENTERYLCGGFSYHRDRRVRDVLRCSERKRGCPGKIRFNADNSGILETMHRNHAPERYLIEVVTARNYIARLALQNTLTPHVIYARAMRKFPDATSNCLSQGQCEHIVFSVRARNRPNIPNTFEELEPLLRNYNFTSDMYRGIVRARDGSTAHIFIDNFMLRQLRSARFLHMDGTFKVTPFAPRADQLFMIHLRIGKTGYAAVYVLTRGRSEQLYREIFRLLKTLVPTLTNTLEAIITDFERALLKAIIAEFPRVRRVGCEFHYYQALFRHWRRCGLSGARQETLWKCWALTKVPPDLWDDVLDMVVDEIEAFPENHYRGGVRFGLYMWRQWRPLAEIIYTMNSAVRTNNLAEAFNRYIVQQLGGIHPNIWTFFQLLRDTMRMTEIKLKAVQNGLRVPVQSNTFLVNEELRIQGIFDRYAPLHVDNLAAYINEMMDRHRVRYLWKLTLQIQREPFNEDDWIFNVADPRDLELLNGLFDDHIAGANRPRNPDAQVRANDRGGLHGRRGPNAQGQPRGQRAPDAGRGRGRGRRERDHGRPY